MDGAEGGMGIGQVQHSGEHSQTRTTEIMENAWFSIIPVCSCLRVAEGNTVIAATPRRCHKNIQHALHNEHSFN
jgi:hypothetical protein